MSYTLLDGTEINDPAIICKLKAYHEELEKKIKQSQLDKIQRIEDEKAIMAAERKSRESLNLGFLDKAPFTWEEWSGDDKVHVTNTAVDGIVYLGTCLINGVYRSLVMPFKVVYDTIKDGDYRMIPGAIVIGMPVHAVFWPIAFTLSGVFGFLNGVCRDIINACIRYTGYEAKWAREKEAYEATSAVEHLRYQTKSRIDDERKIIAKHNADMEDQRVRLTILKEAHDAHVIEIKDAFLELIASGAFKID